VHVVSVLVAALPAVIAPPAAEVVR
jgi:hypothetical protein